jgi:hypothetical protein
MSTALARKTMQARLNSAVSAQESAIELSIAKGDVAEEARRKRALVLLRTKTQRVDSDALRTQATAIRMKRKAAQGGKKDWLTELAVGPGAVLSASHLRTADALRDHANPAGACGGELRERVQGGRSHNGQMEAMVDRRRPLRYAMNAAIEAIGDRRMLPGAMCVIVNGRSLAFACDISGISGGGKGQARIKTAIIEALDGAAAHLGISD